MIRPGFNLAGLVVAACLLPAAIFAQGGGDPQVRNAAQREAMKALAFMDGMWRGPAWIVSPSGERHEFTQTERVGPFLDGSVRVVEGRGYESDGRVGFNALGVISFDPDQKVFTLNSHAMGRSGNYRLTPAANGFVWEIPAGPMTIRYTATITDGTWHEVGDRVAPGQEPARFMEMTLERIGDTDWPGAGAVTPK